MTWKSVSGLFISCMAVLTFGLLSFEIKEAESLTLQEAKEEAVCANVSIKSAREKSLQADFVQKASYTELFPKLSLTGSANYVNQETATTVEQGIYGTFPFGPVPQSDAKVITYENELTSIGKVKIEQPVFQGGKIYYSYKEAVSKTESARMDEQQKIQDILLAVEKSYFSLLKAQDLKRLAEKHENTLKAHLSDIEQMYRKGRVAFNDVLKVKVQVAEAEGDTIKAGNDVSIAEVHLNSLLNRRLDQHLDLAPIVSPEPIAISIDKAEEIAKANNYTLNSLRAQKVAAAYNSKVAEADYYPFLTFSAEYSAAEGQPSYPDDFWKVFLNMDWSFWHWNETKHKVSSARAFERQMEYDMSSFENQISEQIRDAFLQINEIDKRMEIDKEMITQARENLRITQVGFANGRMTSVDVMDAEDIESQAESYFIQDTYDAFIARAQLRYVIGKMEETDILLK